MIEVMIALVERRPISIFTLRLGLRQNGMIFLEEGRPKPTEHVHDPQIIFRVSVAGRRVEHHVFQRPGLVWIRLVPPNEAASTLIARPEVAVDDDGRDAIFTTQMAVCEEFRHDFADRPLHHPPQLGIRAVILLALL